MPAHNRVLRLTPLAEADLEDIWRYTFDRWSLEQANQYHNDLVATMQAWPAATKSVGSVACAMVISSTPRARTSCSTEKQLARSM
jgi:plasmid stabilization system protein ParE